MSSPVFISILTNWLPNLHYRFMHVFVYETPRHRQKGYYNNLAEHVINCQFDIEKLRKGLGKEYKIWGYGIHPIHGFLKRLHLSNLMKGHLIELKDPKRAVWLRLNYDLVGHDGTEYKGIYKDIDLDKLEDLTTRYEAAHSKMNPITVQINKLRNVHRVMNELITVGTGEIKFSYMATVISLNEETEKEIKRLDRIKSKLAAEIAAIKESAVEYIESSKA